MISNTSNRQLVDQDHDSAAASFVDNSLERLTKLIRDKKLEAPALFFLELYRPFVLIGSSLMTVLNPFLNALSIPHKYLSLLQDREKVENLILELENSKEDSKEEKK